MVPQITGGALPGGPVKEKVSVRHLVAWLTALPPAAMLPPTSRLVETVRVDGPAMTKLLKSRRS